MLRYFPKLSISSPLLLNLMNPARSANLPPTCENFDRKSISFFNSSYLLICANNISYVACVSAAAECAFFRSFLQ